MSQIELSSLEGCRPLGYLDPFTDYMLRQQHRGSSIEEVVAQAGLETTAEEVLALSMRSEAQLKAEQGVAPYVAPLVKWYTNHGGLEVRNTERLDTTGLTNLFADTYGVDLTELTNGNEANLSINGALMQNHDGISMNYLAYRPDGTPDIFWQVVASARYGFINLNTVHNALGVPLRGSGNIAFMPGVDQAFMLDIARLAIAGTPEGLQ